VHVDGWKVHDGLSKLPLSVEKGWNPRQLDASRERCKVFVGTAFNYSRKDQRPVIRVDQRPVI
jgi:hypothetical protein